MTSILTNNGAMVALQTLNSINDKLTDVQGQIATGKRVSSAADNASIFAVTTVMQADIDGFSSINETLSLGKATVSVARNASEKVTDLLREVKEKVVLAQGENVDRGKIQTDIDALKNQIDTIVGAAQFNGLNLIDGSGTADVEVLSSLDRSSTGVSSSTISVSRQDLTSNTGTYAGTGAALASVSADVLTNAVTTVGNADTNDVVVDIVSDNAQNDNVFTVTITDGADVNFTYSTTIDGTAGETNDTAATQLAAAIVNSGIEGVTANRSAAGQVTVETTNAFTDFTVTFTAASSGTATVDADNNVNGAAGTATGAVASATQTLASTSEELSFIPGSPAEGTGYQVTIGTEIFEYVAGKNESMNDVVKGLEAVINSGTSNADLTVQANISSDPTSIAPTLQVNYANTGGDIALTVDSGTGGTATGGLIGLDGLSVETAADASRALDTIETLIQASIDASASFGSAEQQIDIQTEFVTSLVDSLKSGVGALVDTDMEKASAELQALQVQQQLGVQALSIANSAPQGVLSLFR